MPLEYQTWEGRYDDPDRTWRTLYLTGDAYGAWVEVLGRFRPHDDLMAALKDITDEDGEQQGTRERPLVDVHACCQPRELAGVLRVEP